MNQETMSEFDIQAQKFIDATNTVMTIKFLKFAKHFINDKDYRDIYEVTLTCGDRNYTFNFGQSLNDSGFKLRYKSGTAKGQEVKYNWENQAIINSNGDAKEFKKICIQKFGNLGNLEIINPIPPSPYDIFASMTKENPESFSIFCDNYGYDEDSIKAQKIYDAVLDEWKNIQILYDDEELDMLREIQ